MEEEHERDVLFHVKLFCFDIDLPFCSISLDKSRYLVAECGKR